MATEDEDQPIDGAEEGVSAQSPMPPPPPASPEADPGVMTPEEARAAGYAPGPEASPDQMTPEEARAAGYVPAHEADPNVMTPEEATAAGYKPQVESSGAGAFARGAARGAITTIASLPEIGIGAGLGSMVLPGIGTAVGALGGAIVGGYMSNDALNTILESLGLRKGTGFASEAQEQADVQQHEYLSEAGNVAGGFAAFGTKAASRAARAGTAAIFGGLETGQELLKGEFDPGKIAIAAAGGYAMGGPRAFAEKMIARGGAMIPGRPDVKGTEQSIKDKEDAATSADVGADNAPGTAVDQPEPSVDVQPTENAPVRSERRYPKDGTKTPTATGLFGEQAHDIMAALDAHARPGMPDPKAEELPLENATNREALQTPPAPAAANDNVQGAPEMVTGAAMRDGESGGVMQGDTHADAAYKLDDAGVNGFGAERGYSTTHRPFVPEAEAIKIANEQGQINKGREADPKSEDINFAPKEPISKNLPSLEAQHAQDIAPTQDAKAQADALQNVKNKQAGQDQPLTAAEEAAPERAAKPAAEADTLPAGAKQASYEAPAPSDAYPHVDPELRGIQIKRQVPAPNLVGSNKAATEVFVDPRVPRSVDVNGKTLDPAQALAVREIARRRVLEELGKPVEGKEKMPFATQIEAAREAGLHAEHMWLDQRGYDPAAFREIMDGVKSGKPAAEAPKPEITATVKPPKFVRRTLEALRAKGMENAAVALETKIKGMAPKDQTAEAAKAAKTITARKPENLSVEQLSQPLKTPRLTKSGYPIGDTGMTAKIPGEAARKGAALKAADTAFKANPAVKGETDEALVARAKKIVADAKTANEGVDPLLVYKKPTKPTPGYLAVKGAQRLATGEVTAKKLAQFRSDEALGFTDLVKETGKIEGGMAKNRQAGDAAIDAATAAKAREFPGETPHEEAEKDMPAEPVKPEDISPAAKEQDLNISDMSEGKQADILADMAKVSENLVNAPDELTGQPKTAKWDLENKDRLAGQQEKMATQKAARLERDALVKKTATKPPEEKVDIGRSIKATPEELAKYGAHADAAALAAKREKDLPANVRKDLDAIGERTGPPAKEYVEPKEGEADLSAIPPKDETVLARFAKDEGGKLDFSKIDGIWNAKINPRLKWFTDLIGHQTRERGIKADSILAQGTAERTRQENMFAKEMDERRVRWVKGSTPDEQIKAQLALETIKSPINAAFDEAKFRTALEDQGISPDKAKWMAKDGQFMRAALDKAWEAEKARGSDADYVENYVSHIFKDEDGARDYIQRKINSLGSNWFTKERSFEMIRDAIKSGYELKYTNPIDVLNARMKASLKFQGIMDTLGDLNDIKLAKPSAEANKMEKLSWHPVNAPDKTQWLIDPTISTLWKNAMESVGLRDRNDMIGSTYRGWMDVKNVFIPIKLGISAFHWVHVVLNVNLAANMARELTNASAVKGGLGAQAGAFASAFPKALKVSMQDALFSLPFDRFGHLGKEGRLAWDTPDAQKSPEQHMVSRLIQEGGGIPHRNEQDLIQDRKRLDEAIAQGSIKQLPLRAQNVVKQASAWMFEQQIPNLKTASYLRDAAALFQRRPDLINNHIQRGVALHTLMKSVDNRFGEMYYNSLFMNRTLKDSAIGSFLSLGWNLGQVREFGGSLANVVTGKGRGAATPSQDTIYQAGNKGAYTLAYVATSMLSAGALSYAMSGVAPTDWKDYFFPRVGGNDPEGQPRRLQTPFNTREPLMLKAHIDSEGPIGGLATFLWNKMILSPVLEALHNKDYYGRELYDTQAPWYTKAFQLVDSIMGDNLTPITASSMQRAKEQGGGGAKESALAIAGFGPAPAYVNRSPLQRTLSEMYFTHGVAQSRPYQDRGPMHAAYNYATGAPPSVGDERSTARAAYNRAAIQGDQAGMAKAKGDLVAKGKMSPATVGGMQPGDADKRMFARVPIEDKQSLVQRMNPEEFRKLVLTNRPISGKDRAVLMKQWGTQHPVNKSALP